MYRRIAWSIGLAGGCLVLILALQAQAAPAVPLRRHCGSVGPLPDTDPDSCGCTWGEVLFHGQPVPGAMITLTYGSGVVTSVTRLTPLEPVPYFDLTAHDLGARRGDVLTLTAEFAGRVVSRIFRAWPGADGEQRVVLALPERGVWRPWVTGGYTRALALAGDTVWAGGPAGVISISLTTGVSVVHTLPWANPFVRALAVGNDGHVWAAGVGGVAEFDGTTWHTHTVPITGTPRALAVDRATGAVWVGGGDVSGSAAVYIAMMARSHDLSRAPTLAAKVATANSGTWQPAGAFPAAVTALAVDSAGRAWAGTWGEGVYRQNGSGGWTQYQDTDGMASDWVLAGASGDGAVWFGTSPYLSGSGPRGGVARYDLAAGTWRVYTAANGLPADADFPQCPAPVYAVTLNGSGTPWIGASDGVRFLVGGGWWAAYTATHGLRPGTVRALVVGNGMAVAAIPVELDRLDPTIVSGALPTAQIDAVSPPTLTMGMTLTLSGEGMDGDENGARIVAWDWASSQNGPLCTAASCALPHSLFTPGIHTISLRMQDDEGVWSAPVTATVTVQETWRICLPLVVRGY